MRTDVDSKDRQHKVTEHTGISDQEGEVPSHPPGQPAGISTSATPSIGSLPPARAAVDTRSHPARDSGSQASVTCPQAEKVEESDPDPIPPMLDPVFILPHPGSSKGRLAGRGQNLSTSIKILAPPT